MKVIKKGKSYMLSGVIGFPSPEEFTCEEKHIKEAIRAYKNGKLFKGIYDNDEYVVKTLKIVGKKIHITATMENKNEELLTNPQGYTFNIQFGLSSFITRAHGVIEARKIKVSAIVIEENDR